jgi:ubiquinone/menaquinone biosynthesis C-methylase UbiE
MFDSEGPSFFELMVQALSSTDRGYDLLAPKFDHTPFRTPDVVLDAASPHLGPTVERGLDLCCGTGAGLFLLRKHCRRVVGIDRSAGMLAEAHQRLSAEAGAPFELVRGEVLDAPFAASFDLVSCFGAFGHILEEDEERFVASVHSLLKPGGRFVFYTAEPPPMTSPGFWVAHGFNLAMRIRNALLSPPFIMYYLTFLVPRAKALLEAKGFGVEVKSDVAPKPYNGLKLVIATRR